ncbi:bacteriorhodopsin [Halobaculum sp. MBLA0147]|uniref:bacteriorhodopsin n=1 Tax=Halobaculum sp. MBLA0147 TaxID=3079934 RepID=UPI00352535E0
MSILGLTLTRPLVYGLGTVLMTLGLATTLVGWRFGRGDDAPFDARGYGMLAGLVGVAAVAYFVMTLGVGDFTQNGTYVESIRYLDWALSTPLIIGFIAYAGGASQREVVGAILADLLMILIGFGALLVTGIFVWVGFVLSTAAYLGLVYYLFGPLTESAKSRTRDQYALFAKLRNLIGVLWFVYPIVWAVSPAALGLTDIVTTAVIITYLDVTAKVGMIAIVVNTAGVVDRFVASDGDASATQ